MSHNKLNRLIAVLIFVVAEAVYLATMAPTLSFWDCGEVIATSRTLGVPHPPGAPLYLLFGHLFSLLPTFGDIGARINFFSTLLSSATIMLTYLIIVRLITIARNSKPAEWDLPDKIAAYGGAAVGALALAFSDSFWFNAVETSLWAASSFLTATIFWMMLCWYDEDPAPGSERWLLAVMYMIGLSIGVHLLCLLALFSLVLLYYFKKYPVTLKSFSLMGLFSLGLFFLIYRGIIKELPVLLVHTSWWGLGLLITLLVYGVWFSQQKRLVLPNLVLMSVLLLILGYTSYLLIFVRAHAGPPINENDPSTLQAFFSYVNREQYGSWPLWPRRWSPEPVHQYFYRFYSGDWDYFFRYQLDLMYLRYFGWQFIGRSAPIEGAVIDWGQLWGVPLLAGLYGAVSHFRRNWKMALVVGVLFAMTGLILVVYLNQPEPQPRERDYSYVGSFFAFALWIGIGIESLWASASKALKSAEVRNRTLSAALLVFAALYLIDGRMVMANYRTHDRSGNYVAWDWAWNILQSCEKDAILFTNGDNDTFPLWYMQEVEGVRTDVRVVNLSLANTGWYLLQLKHDSPRGAKPVELKISDADLKAITYVPVDSVDVAVPAGSEQRKLFSDARRSGVSLPATPSDSLRWRIRPGLSYQGTTYLRPQDIAVYMIVSDNYGKRPIYFALTVDPTEMIGLERNLRLDGLVYRVVPLRSDSAQDFSDPGTLYGNLFNTYRYRNIGNLSVNIDETSRNLLGNYPPLFGRLALDLSAAPGDSVRVPDKSGVLQTRQRRALAYEVLDRYEKLFPLERYPVSPSFAATVASLRISEGAKQKAYPYINYLEVLASRSDVREEPELYLLLSQVYRKAGESGKADAVLNHLKQALPALRERLDSLKQ
ncbi:conserved hypothetical protein [Chlorobaculum parvum NCIB 8327]|uniref:DUF2723 domain-containing protein n=1 Tax=Chlorobaculum parvum (strain DSM 263 / NCIMB 8327) TaxID=517417 RepID=B3QR03_CHLP8|nr:DUF2723 domain-containing protein [Chlorobaculum parvum]ACF10657.1 conserved hypothetical protein [Chlorobaculum parvum NCIB 8327]